ncbi:MAG: outer membrane protein transport protein [Polyangiales bacterium]
MNTKFPNHAKYRNWALAPLIGAAGLVSSIASASTEPPSVYDARSVGMGGTGGAYLENGASVYHNPAALDGIAKGAFTLVLSPTSTVIHSPVAGPNTSVKSDASTFPLFLLGGAYRVSDRVVVGLAAYPTAGFGSGYSNVAAFGGQDLKFAIVAMEAAPAASFKITDRLSLGLAWRITYVHQSASQPLPPPTGGALEQALDGTSFVGANLGAYYRPSDDLHLALTYRSKVTAKLKGKTTIGGTDFDTSGDFAAAPHTFKAAAAGWLLQRRVMLAIDVKYLLFKEANEEIALTTDTPAGPQTATIPLHWRNVLAVNAGVEVAIDGPYAVRAGYTISQSATPSESAAYFTPPPGILQAIHLGAGARYEHWDIDLGGAYAFGSSTATPADARTNAGKFRFTTIMGSVSLTYRM